MFMWKVISISGVTTGGGGGGTGPQIGPQKKKIKG